MVLNHDKHVGEENTFAISHATASPRHTFSCSLPFADGSLASTIWTARPNDGDTVLKNARRSAFFPAAVGAAGTIVMSRAPIPRNRRLQGASIRGRA